MGKVLGQKQVQFFAAIMTPMMMRNNWQSICLGYLGQHNIGKKKPILFVLPKVAKANSLPIVAHHYRWWFCTCPSKKLCQCKYCFLNHRYESIAQCLLRDRLVAPDVNKK
jgi:hypothetical protein